MAHKITIVIPVFQDDPFKMAYPVYVSDSVKNVQELMRLLLGSFATVQDNETNVQSVPEFLRRHPEISHV